MDKRISLFWLIKHSLILDIKLFRVSKWPYYKKLAFLSKKYWLQFLLTTKIKKFVLGESFIKLFNKKIYFDSCFGLGGYQSIFTRLQNMVNLAGMKDVKTAIDIGANVGFFSMLINDRFPEARIFAIEPIPRIFIALRKNFQNNDRVEFFNRAISNFNGLSEMEFDKQNPAVSRIVDRDINNKNNQRVIKVNTQTLDSFVEENEIDYIDILKIDVETFEKHVLEGGPDTLAKTHYLFIEITVKDNENYTFSQLNSLLYSYNYNFQLVAFRNYLDKGEGRLPLGDFLFENINFLRRN